MAQLTKPGIILSFSIFFFFLIQVGSMASVELIKGFNPSPLINLTGVGFLDILIGVINNIATFTSLLGVSSEWALFSGIILSGFALTLLWMLLELLRGV